MPSFICSCTLVGDVAALELDDLQLNERSGTFRFGKGAKERWIPLPISARRALQTYLEVRPPAASRNIFIGERGALSESGIRQLCDKYSAISCDQDGGHHDENRGVQGPKKGPQQLTAVPLLDSDAFSAVI